VTATAASQNRRLFTCSFSEFRPEMGIPVRFTAFYPRWGLPYQLAGNAKLIAPPRAIIKLDREPYTPLYIASIEAAGVEAIRGELRTLTGAYPAGMPIVLLCFEKLSKPGAWCHRRLFAEWWHGKTGEVVAELGATAQDTGTQPAQGALF